MYRHAFVLNAFQKIGPIEVKPLFWNKAVRAGRTSGITAIWPTLLYSQPWTLEPWATQFSVALLGRAWNRLPVAERRQGRTELDSRVGVALRDSMKLTQSGWVRQSAVIMIEKEMRMRTSVGEEANSFEIQLPSANEIHKKLHYVRRMSIFGWNLIDIKWLLRILRDLYLSYFWCYDLHLGNSAPPQHSLPAISMIRHSQASIN